MKEDRSCDNAESVSKLSEMVYHISLGFKYFNMFISQFQTFGILYGYNLHDIMQYAQGTTPADL